MSFVTATPGMKPEPSSAELVDSSQQLQFPSIQRDTADSARHENARGLVVPGFVRHSPQTNGKDSDGFVRGRHGEKSEKRKRGFIKARRRRHSVWGFDLANKS